MGCFRYHIAFLAVAGLLGACDEATEPDTALLDVRGTVTEAGPGGHAVAGALVLVSVLVPEGAGAWASDSTDADGLYAVQVQVPGGCNARDSVSVIHRVEARDFRARQHTCGWDPQGRAYCCGLTTDDQTFCWGQREVLGAGLSWMRPPEPDTERP